MFSLIISLISIALVASLGFASIFYGFYSYQSNYRSSQVAYLLNTANTVGAAAILGKNNGLVLSGRSVANVIILKDAEYLTLVPQYKDVSFLIDADQSLVKIQNSNKLSEDLCKTIIASYDHVKPADVMTIPNGTIESRKYGCHVGSSGSGYYTFYYRYDK